MKKTNIAKRIVSVLLAMSIVLSFALVSVSALPADYTVVDEKYEFIDFEDNVNTMISTSGGIGGTKGKIEDGSVTHSGTHSTILTAPASGNIKIWYTPFKNTSYAGWEANSTYYMSFWFYSDTWACDTTIWGDDGYTYTASFSSKTKGQWNKAMLKITTGASPAAAGFPIGAYQIGAGATIYFDDFEVAKVDGFTAKTASVPEGATATVTGITDFDTAQMPVTGSVSNVGVAMSIKSGNATKVGATVSEAHWGERSYAIQGNEGNTGSATFYFHPRLLMTPYSTCDDVLPVGTYYFSYYVYSDVAVRTSTVSNVGSLVAPTSVPAGEWTKAEGVFTVAETKVNSGIFDITVENLGENAVYFDDFILAQVTIDGEVTLTAEDVDFDYDALDAATVTVTSPVKLKTAEVTAPEGVTVESATVVDGKLVIALSGVELGEEYELSVSGVDIFDGTYEETVAVTMPSAALAPMKIVASSIEDGATGVMAPVSYIYIDAPHALNAGTLAGNITITGENATVTGATLVDEDTIKVSLDGVLPLETYVLSVDGVENTEGGVLTDRITFTTKGDGSYVLDFEDGLPSQFVWTGLGYGGTCNLSDNAYSGDQSVALLADGLSMGYASFKLAGIKPNTAYRISFCYSSQYWGGNITSQSGNGTWANSVISDTDKAGWKKITVDYTSDEESTMASVQLYNFFAAGQNTSCVDTVYIDDLKVQEVGSIAQPVIIAADGTYDDAISAGATVEIPVVATVAADAIKVIVVQYGENNKMISATSYTNAGSGAAISFTVPDTANKTKVIIMNATTYAPLCDAYAMNY